MGMSETKAYTPVRPLSGSPIRVYRSSKTNARFGHASTHAGIFRSGHKSHFDITFRSNSFLFVFRKSREILPYGHAITHIQHPIHFSGLTSTGEFASCREIAPVIQASKHAGSIQCRHWVEIDTAGPCSSTTVFDTCRGVSSLYAL